MRVLFLSGIHGSPAIWEPAAALPWVDAVDQIPVFSETSHFRMLEQPLAFQVVLAQGLRQSQANVSPDPDSRVQPVEPSSRSDR